MGLGAGLDSGKKHLVPVPGIEALPLGSPACSPYAVPTTQPLPLFLSINSPSPHPPPERYEQLLTVMLMLVTLTEGYAAYYSTSNACGNES